METSNKSIENFNELIFENRHKEYGAYAIRKSYNNAVALALIISTSFFLLLTLTAAWFTNSKIKLPNIIAANDLPPLCEIPRVNLPQPVGEIEIKIEKPLSTPKTTSGWKASDDETKTTAEVDIKTDISENSNPDSNDKSDSTAKDEPGNQKGIAVNTSEKIEMVPEQMPELTNMDKFIAENIQYPDIAVTNKTSGIVYVTFVVEKDGSVSNIKILKDIGDDCGKEAIRVIKMLPKWKPGMVHGMPVRVQCNLPVRFRLK